MTKESLNKGNDLLAKIRIVQDHNTSIKNQLRLTNYEESFYVVAGHRNNSGAIPVDIGIWIDALNAQFKLNAEKIAGLEREFDQL